MSKRFVKAVGSMFFREASIDFDRWWSRLLHGDMAMLKPILYYLWRCETCGALVLEEDRELHGDWHGKRGE